MNSISSKHLFFAALSALLTVSLCHAQQRTPSPTVVLQQTDAAVVLSNGFVQFTFDRASHRITQLAADHTGTGAYSHNLLTSDGMQFTHEDPAASPNTEVAVQERSNTKIAVAFTWPDGVSHALISVSMRLSADDRGPDITATCPAQTADCGEISAWMDQWFMLGIFQRGVLQYISGQNQQFTSHDTLKLFYTIDRDNGSVAILPESARPGAETTIVSVSAPNAAGIILRPTSTTDEVDRWLPSPPPIDIKARHAHSLRFHLYANDLPYPADLPQNTILDKNNPASRDAEAYFTGVYASAAGVLGSYQEPGSGYPTLSVPMRAYGTGFDFFDPDAWEIVAPLSFSGDPLLQNEARKILERSESGMLPDGQIPHHFQNGVPVYLSIAKSKQTGPNLFWTLAALEYASATGNEAWLRAHYAHLQKATQWILNQFDLHEGLLNVEGPLFIDVFRRSGYTLDTNAMTIYLMQQMAEAAAFNHDAPSRARYLSFAEKLKAGIQAHLWNGDDHFITQRNPDGSPRDMVDYDGNFAALAFGVVSDRATEDKILQRLDSGPHTHPNGRGTWVSEKFYTSDDCYGGNIGDSNVAMARIWWLDSLTRVHLGDHAMFDALLNNMEGDLLRETWMAERYNAAGGPAHNSYYHEYPEVISMVLREQRYGVHVGMQNITIDPFGTQSFAMRLGTLQVAYSPQHVSLLIPGSSLRDFSIGGLPPDTSWRLPGGKRAYTSNTGWLHFTAHAGQLLTLQQDSTK